MVLYNTDALIGAQGKVVLLECVGGESICECVCEYALKQCSAAQGSVEETKVLVCDKCLCVSSCAASFQHESQWDRGIGG